MKKCLYCGDFIDTKADDFEKLGTKYICVFCYEENAHELDPYEENIEDDYNNDSGE